MNFTDETQEDLQALILRDFGALPQDGLSNRIVLAL
jgi:hypothetical protein